MGDKVWIAYAWGDPYDAPVLESFDRPPRRGYISSMFGHGVLYEFEFDASGAAVNPKLLRIETEIPRSKIND